MTTNTTAQTPETEREMLKAFLHGLVGDFKPEPVYWVSIKNGDSISHVNPTMYCRDCCQQEVDALNHQHPESKHDPLGGGGPLELALFPDCSCCAKMLNVLPNETGVGNAVDDFIAQGIRLEGDGAHRVALKLLRLLDHPSHHFDALATDLADMVRRGERSLSSQHLVHISLDAAVIDAARARRGHAGEVSYALQKGGNPDAIDPDTGLRALHWACKNYKVDMLKALLSHGADPERQVLPRHHKDAISLQLAGLTAVHMAARFLPLLEVMLPHAPNVDVRDPLGRTALHLVCADPSAVVEPDLVIRKLLDAGADANARDNSGATPVMILEANGRTDLSELIQSYHAAVTAKRAIDDLGSDRQVLRPLS